MIAFREIRKEDDEALALLIRTNLKAHGLDIEGTVYFDDNLDHLSDYYLSKKDERFYLIALDDDKLIGGIGLAKLEFIDNCCELQKLYISDEYKGRGLSYKLIEMIEKKAVLMGYEKMYLETHDNLKVAIHTYERCAYKEIQRPEGVVHSTMNRFFLKEF